MKGIRLLLVDDEVVFATNLAKILTRRGYEVTTVHHGQAALQKAQIHHFDVIILDQKMPGMDGISALKQLKSITPDAEVLILTGHGTAETGITGLMSGAYDYLMKPIQADDLIKKINQAYDRKLVRESSARR
jgi:DNA-binding response OmpR family regulator